MFLRRVVVPLICTLIVAFLPLSALAQPSTGKISGTVRDSGGAPMAGAAITITNQETLATRVIRSATAGVYEATDLPPGLYTVSADFPGSRKVTQRDRQLAAGATLVVTNDHVFAAAVAEELRGIGLGEGEFRVELREREGAPSGADEAAFLIRPNPGLPFAPAAETASGGELSRIALAIAAVGGGETMVFDEIDAGIGGQTAHAVGETLQRLAGRAQVVTITHLPQIATLAERHFRVEKVAGDPTHTTIEALEDDDRREELRRMLGGEQFISAVQEQ